MLSVLTWPSIRAICDVQGTFEIQCGAATSEVATRRTPKAHRMPRLERLEFKDAIHYAQVRGRTGADIFFDPHTLRRFPQAPRQNAPHAQTFELLLATA